MPTTPKPDFVDIRETDGDSLHSIRWGNVEDILDKTDDPEPLFEIRMMSGRVYVVKDANCFEAIRTRRKDSR